MYGLPEHKAAADERGARVRHAVTASNALRLDKIAAIHASKSRQTC